MDAGLYELIRARDGASRAEAIVRLAPTKELPDYVERIATFGDIATCRLRVSDIEKARESDAVESLKAPRVVRCASPWTDDDADDVSERGPGPRDAAGRGVVIAFLDFGFDVAHPNFRERDGTTRLLGLFDQRKPMRTDRPNPYGYGRIYSSRDIDEALAHGDPYERLDYQPSESDRGAGAHGTHTLDIAAGSGRLAGSSPGVSPASELLCVHLATSGTSGTADLGDSVRLLEGLDYVRRVAGARPWVANLSLGAMGGDHSGESLVERAMDAMLVEAPGRAIVQSTGNYFDARTHTHGRLRPSGRASFDWVVHPSDRTPNELEVWYSGRDRFRVELRAPDSDAVFVAKLASDTPVLHDGQEVGRLYHRARDPQTGYHHVDIFLHVAARPGTWTVTLIGEDVTDGRFHVWIERDGTRANQSRLGPGVATHRYTTGSIANGYRPIVVGAFDGRAVDWPLASFSSSGPTRDGRQKPDLLAPGVGIRAARSTPRGAAPGSGGTTVMSGTSMAAPWVTGAVARVFERAAEPLAISRTRALILANTRAAPELDPYRAGNGYLDLAAVERAAGARRSQETDMSERTEQNGFVPLSQQTAIFPKKRPRPELEERTVRNRNFVLISGGPGPFDNRDVQHDQSWSNYVDPPLWQTDKPSELTSFSQPDEEVWWFVYKPAYERRWADDQKSTLKHTQDEVARVKTKYGSYVELLEKRVAERKKHGWHLRWITSGADLWKRLETFGNEISRVWYWGHAADELWLSIQHDSSGVPEQPDADEIIDVDDVKNHAALKSKFQSGDFDRVHRFVGCNTAKFAKVWARTFGVWAEGVDGFVHFCSIPQTGGKTCRFKADGSYAKVKFFSPAGSYDSSKDHKSKMAKCDTPKDLCPASGASGASAETIVAEGVPVATLSAIQGQLHRKLRRDDRAGIQDRRRRLVELFRSIPRRDARSVYERLSRPSSSDALARSFNRRLATATRKALLCVLLQTEFQLPSRTGSGARGLTTQQACQVIFIALWLRRQITKLEREGVVTTGDAEEFQRWASFLIQEAQHLSRFRPATPAQIGALRKRARELLADAEKLKRFPASLRGRRRATPAGKRSKLLSHLDVSPSTIRVHENEAARISFRVGPQIQSLSVILLQDEKKEGTVFREFVWRSPSEGHQIAIWDGTFRTVRNQPPRTGTYRARIMARGKDGSSETLFANIRVENPHKKTVLPRTQSGLRPEKLSFDGRHLTLHDEGGHTIRMRAAAGLKPGNPANRDGVDYTQPEHQHLANRGPIPEGSYAVRAGELQSPALVGGRLVYPSGSSAAVWGPRRIPLHATRPGKRHGFHVHLDLGNDGTAGGIGVHPGDEGKFNQMTAIVDFGLKRGETLPVIVRYPDTETGPESESFEESDARSPDWRRAFRNAKPEDALQRELVRLLALPIPSTATKRIERRARALRELVAGASGSSAKRLLARLTTHADALGQLYQLELMTSFRNELVDQLTATVAREGSRQVPPSPTPHRPEPSKSTPVLPDRPDPKPEPEPEPGPKRRIETPDPPKLPEPRNEIIDPPPDWKGREWLFRALESLGGGVGAGVAVAGLALIPAWVLENAIQAAFAVYVQENLKPKQLLGRAGEEAAKVVAEWFYERANGEVLDLNDVKKNFRLADLLAPEKPLSVKTFLALSNVEYGSPAWERRIQSAYKQAFREIWDKHDVRFVNKRKRTAKFWLKFEDELRRRGFWPKSLAEPATEEQVAHFLRESTGMLIPSDHLLVFKKSFGTELAELYRAGKLDWPRGLTTEQMAARVNGVLGRIQSSGIRERDLRHLIDIVERLPAVRKKIIGARRKPWPKAWGEPPTWGR